MLISRDPNSKVVGDLQGSGKIGQKGVDIYTWAFTMVPFFSLFSKNYVFKKNGDI